tara:strand:- start:471 stop:644 length:174 start_codon:yes stop_codon:yes gene_type:complete
MIGLTTLMWLILALRSIFQLWQSYSNYQVMRGNDRKLGVNDPSLINKLHPANAIQSG